MPDLVQFLLYDQLLLSLMTVFAGSFALFYWIRPGDPSQVEPMSAIQMLNSSHGLYLDVRPAGEFEKGHIVNSRNIPVEGIDSKLDGIRKFKGKPVIVVCERGHHSQAATKKLRGDGFEKVFLLRGGLNAWRTANLPLKRKP